MRDTEEKKDESEYDRKENRDDKIMTSVEEKEEIK